jgi:hypothetical protein
MTTATANGVHKPKGPFKLVTVNTAPDRAARLIGRMVDGLKAQYTIQHVANVTGIFSWFEGLKIPHTDFANVEIKDVKATVEKFQPDLLVS